LIRRASDRGVFVLLDARADAVLSGLPPGVTIERVGIADHCHRWDFLHARAC
jgi:Rad3-related DNA helicase